jgi:hypothetical protein
MEIAPNIRSASGRGSGSELVRKDGRSAVTNGKRLHVAIGPGTSAWARRFRDVYNQLLAENGGDTAWEDQKQLCRRATTLSIKCEQMEGEQAQGHEIDDELYGKVTDRLGRVFARLASLRAKRQQQARDVTSLGMLLQADHIQQQQQDQVRNAEKRKQFESKKNVSNGG